MIYGARIGASKFQEFSYMPCLGRSRGARSPRATQHRELLPFGGRVSVRRACAY